tara:strand:- start:1049 stop:2305 length:1257 start_codon:yes stop_codon:yes gene_type:complete
MQKKRVFHDPIHKEIIIDSSKDEEAMIMELIETEAFQRLRRIKQLGTASLVFHGAESSRFTHSIGVFCVARKIYKRLVEINPSFEINKFTLYGAALLHDIGHGPLSHTSEQIFAHNHEDWSKKLITNYQPINLILKKYGAEIPTSIGNLFNSKNLTDNPLKTLISSEIDCDRLDYLLRDSYNTGTKYGLVDLERIISALIFSPDGGVAIKPKGVIAIEHFLILRNIMYRSIYNHKINEICTWILENIFNTIRAEFKGEIWIDECMRNWIFAPNKLDFNNFLANDDIRLYYHLYKWKDDSPNPISILCEMFINRNLLKASNINFLSNINKLELLAYARKKSSEKNYDPSLFCGIKEKKFNGFESNNSLKVWDGNILKELDVESPLINILIQNQESSLLFYPSCIKEEIMKKIIELTDKR